MSAIAKLRPPVQPWHTQGGVTHFTRFECMTWFRSLCTSEEYRENFARRLMNGTLPPALEALALHYAFGKPTEHVTMNVQHEGHDLSSLSTAELLARVDSLREQLRRADQLEKELDAVTIDVEAEVV